MILLDKLTQKNKSAVTGKIAAIEIIVVKLRNFLYHNNAIPFCIDFLLTILYRNRTYE